MPNNIAISITADVIDLQAKRAIMSAELKAATKDLNDFAKEAAASGSTDELRAGMLASAEAAQKARNSIAGVNAELKKTAVEAAAASHMKEGFGGISVGVREMGVQLRETVGMVGEMREAMMAFGEAMIAAFALERIADWAKEMGENAEKIKHLGETFGMTTPQVQGLQAAAALTGMSVDSLTRGFGILDKNAVTAARGTSAVSQAFKAVGISANDGRTQMERVQVIADKFKDMADGPNKVALAMELFGKSGKDMIPFLNMGAAGIEELDQKTQSYSAGVLIAADANKELRDWLEQVNAKGVALAESTNETKVAWQGLANVMTDAFAPVLKDVTDGLNSLIKAFIDSYREGGEVKIVLDTIIGTTEALWTAVKALGAVFHEIFSAIIEIVGDVAKGIMDAFGIKTPEAFRTAQGFWNVFVDNMVAGKDAILIAIDLIKGAIEVLINWLNTLGKVAIDAMTLHWGSISADWQAGLNHLSSQVAATTKQIQAHTKEMQAALAAAMKGQGMHPGGGIPEPKAGGDFNPNLTGGKHHKAKKGKDEVVQHLEEKLEAEKLAWAMEQDAQGTAVAFSLQTEADYWKKVLDGTNLSAKDRMAVEQKYLAVHGQLIKQKLAIEEDAFKNEMTAANKNAEAKLAIANQELAWIKKTYGEQSTEYANMQKQIVSITREVANQRQQIETDHAKSVEQIELLQITAEENAAKHRVAMGKETNAQLIAEDRRYEEQRWAIEKAALEREMALATANNDPTKAAQIHNQLLIAEQQFQNKMTQIDQQAELQRTQIRRTAINSITQSFAQGIGQMVSLQQGFAGAMRSVWQGIQSAVAQAVTSMVEQFILGLLVKKTMSKAMQKDEVTGTAKEAAAHAYSAIVKIPVVGPFLAPPAAAAAYAAVSAYSAEGGDWDVKEGLYKLHTQEMVLPSHLATPLRSLVEGGGANDNTAGANRTTPADSATGPTSKASGGDAHLHYSPTIHGSAPKGLDQMLREEGDSMVRWFGGALRSGALKIG